MVYTTTKSYVLRSYNGGKIEQSYTDLTAGNTITYTIVPEAGYKIKLLELYRFDTPTLSSVNFSRATKVATLDFDNPKYTITNDDLGKSLCIRAEFENTNLAFIGVVHDFTGQVKYTIKGNTVTITPDDNLKLYSLYANVFPYSYGRPEKINATINNNVATLVIPNAYLNNRRAVLSLYYEFIKTVESLGVTDDTKQNATILVKNNTITITPNAGYNIISANLYTINSYDHYTHHKTNETSFKIENNIATLTFDNVQDLRNNYEIHVSYETKKQETKPKDETQPKDEPKKQETQPKDEPKKQETKPKDETQPKDEPKKQETQPKDEPKKQETQPTPNTGTNVIRLYEIDDETLDKISKKDITVFQNEAPQRYDFQAFINQLYKLPFAIPESYLTTTKQIITGYFTIDAPAYKINKENYSLKIGSITVPTTNGFDYNIKDISLILPWLPTVKLSSSDILGKTISIVYNLSFLDGTTTVVIKSDNTVVESFQNNIAQNLELFNIYSNRENGSLNSTLQNDLRQAYIKINYYKPVDNLISYPTNEHGTLKDYHGFTKVKNIILSKSINADIDDLIINQLKQGVIINDTKRN